MEEKEFNLLDEPWIRVVTLSLEQKEVSLTDALVHAHEYKYLSGEMPTQDAAILRVLLAAAVTIFYRYDANGKRQDLADEEDGYDDTDDDGEEDEEGIVTNEVMRRWRNYWKQGKLPEQTVREYLETWRERFWLFHPETPFWQVKELKYGTAYGAKCLFGNIKESKNPDTRHHFSMTDGEELKCLDYGEAARWLVHLNAYGVNVKTNEKAPGPGRPVGVGMLGQLGFVMVNGENLFQVLMLNLCAQKTDKGLWEEPKPVWEQPVRTEQGCKRDSIDNLPELYTIQSRRIALEKDKDGGVTGFRAIGGDFCSLEEDYFHEPMTIWKLKKADKKADKQTFEPRRHDPTVHAWREFPALLIKKEQHIPGIVQWIQELHRCHLLFPDFQLTFRMIGMAYGDQKSYTYGECVNDSFSMSAELLGELGTTWKVHISDQVENCQNVAKAMGDAAYKLNQLFYGNGSAKSGIKDALVRQYYFSIDGPFREWLAGIKPKSDSPEEKQAEWEKQSYYYARKTVEDYVSTLGADLYIGRQESKGGKTMLLTIPGILNGYLWKLSTIYKKIDGES